VEYLPRNGGLDTEVMTPQSHLIEAVKTLLLGIHIHNERDVGKPAQRIDGPVIDDLRAALTSAEAAAGAGRDEREAFDRERAKEDRAAIAKLSRALGSPCVASTVSLADGVVEYAIQKLKATHD
jgi:hypothetical protein